MGQLRPYQMEDAKALTDILHKEQKRAMYQAHTGSGKTEVFIYVANYHMAMFPGSRVVVLEGSNLLIQQTYRRFVINGQRDVYPMSAYSWPAHLKGQLPDSKVLVVNPLVLGRRTKGEMDNFFSSKDLLVVDEAHHAVASTWEAVIKNFPGYVLGVTATPWRLSPYEGFDHLFQRMHIGKSMTWLVENGYLSPIAIHSPGEEMYLIHGGRVVAGDYLDADIWHLNQKAVLVDNAISYWENIAGTGWQTIWYCATGEHATEVEKELRRRGYSTGGSALLSEPPKGVKKAKHDQTRAELVEGFQKGTNEHLVNVFIAKEGFDVPTADCVMFLRPTLSKSVYKQAGGRCTRPSTEHDYSLFVDMTASWKDGRVGHLLSEYSWSLKPRAEHTPGEAPKKYCPECGSANPVGVHNCCAYIEMQAHGPVLPGDPFPLQVMVKCDEPFGKECAGCRWRPWERWRVAASHFLESLRGDERCVFCRSGAKKPLMYEIRQGWEWEQGTEHLANVMLTQFLTKDGDKWIAKWIDTNTGEEYHREVFNPSIGQWETENHSDEWKYCARVLHSACTPAELTELEKAGALERLIALGFITSEQEAYYQIDGERALTIARDDHGLRPVVSKQRFSDSWREHSEGYIMQYVHEWGIRIGVSSKNGSHTWRAFTTDPSMRRLVEVLNQEENTFASLDETTGHAFDTIQSAVMQVDFAKQT